MQALVTMLSTAVARVRLFPGAPEAESCALNRYGFLDESAFTASSTPPLSLQWDADSQTLTASDAERGRLFQFVAAEFAATGATAIFATSDAEEDWVGFGDQTRERLFHRGHRACCHISNVRSYIPVPFFMSTRGYAILVNTTYQVDFDMGASHHDRFAWRDHGGKIDFYVFSGRDFQELLQRYTELSGKPQMPPEWAFGTWYIARTQANDREVLDDAINFRRTGIPCDVMGLEPGWMDTNYDITTQKSWNRDRFPLPDWQKKCDHTFIKALKRMGFKLELWLCCDYDLSFEEERRRQRLTGEEPAATTGIGAALFCDGAETDDHFAEPRYLDESTKPEEPWFDHLKKFVDWGADFFKQDGAFQICPHPDRYWSGAGMTDAEMHNLSALLYSRQMNEGFAAHTNRRPVVFNVAGWTGFQHYCGTWTGDTGGRLETLGAMLNTAMVGHSWCTNDMEVMQCEGVHFGYLQPWAQINSWTYFRMPWLQGEKLLAMHQFYGRLRSRLIPYLYSWGYQATQTGLPLLRPLALEFPADRNCRTVMHEYLLGRDLLVGIYKPETYFPAGRWKNVWTGAVITSHGETLPCPWPEDRGGNLFLRSGAIIPRGPVMNYRGERALDEVEIYCFPGDAPATEFAFYEDDGVSFAYRDAGDFTLTQMTLRPLSEGWSFTLTEPPHPRVANRRWSLTVALDATPTAVQNNGQPVAFEFDAARGELHLSAIAPGVVTLRR